MEEYSEKVCLCALNRIFGFRPALAHSLIAASGSAMAAFASGSSFLEEILGPYNPLVRSINEDEIIKSGNELRNLADRGISFIPIVDPAYPKLLLECEDAPLGLYYKGCDPPEKVFNCRTQGAVVGTRDISPYGREWCRKIIQGLAATTNPPMIVSGLALGTDICAHICALENGIPTVGVLPTGLDTVYPWSNNKWAEKMAGTPMCALVSDYPPNTRPQAINFIRRNRIIAGLSEWTVLIESKSKGGGMITAHLAQTYNRDVHALPGRVDDIRSQGCNELIKRKLAEPIGDIDSFISSLGLSSEGRKKKDRFEDIVIRHFQSSLSEEELNSISKIISVLAQNRGADIERLCILTGMDYRSVSSFCTILESNGFIYRDLLQRCSING